MTPAARSPSRACTAEDRVRLDDRWAERQFTRALDLRRRSFGPSTTGYRILNGEGTRSLVSSSTATATSASCRSTVPAPRGSGTSTASPSGSSARAASKGSTSNPATASRKAAASPGSFHPDGVAPFLENSLRFTADFRRGQKTGFFLDQRDNRDLIRRQSEGRSVVNIFGYTGGFSVAAGVGGASHVTTVDLAAPAIAAAATHWTLNDLPRRPPRGVAADAFASLEGAAGQR